MLYPFSEVLDAHPLSPPYYKYDEEDVSKLSFDIFYGMKKVWFKEANEYKITIARILLKHTDMTVFSLRQRTKICFLP